MHRETKQHGEYHTETHTHPHTHAILPVGKLEGPMAQFNLDL